MNKVHKHGTGILLAALLILPLSANALSSAEVREIKNEIRAEARKTRKTVEWEARRNEVEPVRKEHRARRELFERIRRDHR